MLAGIPKRSHLGFDAGETLHQSNIAKCVGGPLCQIGMLVLNLALHRFGLAQNQRRQRGEQHAQHDQQDRQLPIDQERQRQHNQ